MKITSIEVYQLDLPLHEGSYKWSGGKSVDVFDSTVVRIQTDAGVDGFGEVCPLGPFYLPSYAAGARVGIGELAPQILGMDPTAVDVLTRFMDRALKGHPYVKSAIDMACWDLLGKVSNQPVCTLLGGRYGKQYGPGDFFERRTLQASYKADRALEQCRYSGYETSGEGIGEFMRIVKD